GLGSAYIAAFAWALARDYDLVFEMDCDVSHDPSDLPRFLTAIEDADLVLGSRYVKGGSTPDWGLKRRIISRGGNLFSRRLLGLKTHDCTGGYRCYRRELLEQIPFAEIGVHGYSFQVAMVYHVERLGGRICEIPITFRDRRLGSSKMSGDIVREALVYVVGLALSGVRANPERDEVRPQGTGEA
ncbi:MAG: glycosyltransferase, partial [Anaerolineae bacterium]